MLSDEEFRALQEIIYRLSGIHLTDRKRLLVENRLRKVITKGGFTGYADLIQELRGGRNDELLSELVNHISTNHTYFFREALHFDVLRKSVLPEWMDRLTQARDLDLRVWSAGCSSGEEAWTLAIVLREALGSDYGRFKAGVLATDLSSRVLSVAKDGKYAADRFKDMPLDIRNRYFSAVSPDEFLVCSELKREVVFRRLNLMAQTFPFKRRFHIIFCRNVMIYFDSETRRRLVLKFLDWLEPGGYLFIGMAEALHGISNIVSVAPSVYRKVSE